MAYQVNSAPSPSYNGSPNSFGLGEGYVCCFLPLRVHGVIVGIGSFLDLLLCLFPPLVPWH